MTVGIQIVDHSNGMPAVSATLPNRPIGTNSCRAISDRSEKGREFFDDGLITNQSDARFRSIPFLGLANPAIAIDETSPEVPIQFQKRRHSAVCFWRYHPAKRKCVSQALGSQIQPNRFAAVVLTTWYHLNRMLRTEEATKLLQVASVSLGNHKYNVGTALSRVGRNAAIGHEKSNPVGGSLAGSGSIENGVIQRQAWTSFLQASCLHTMPTQAVRDKRAASIEHDCESVTRDTVRVLLDDQPFLFFGDWARPRHTSTLCDGEALG